VAHDLNNLLVPIMGYADLIQQTPPSGSIPEMAQQIRSAAERSRDLVQQLLAFARKQVLEPAVLDLRTVVSDMESLLRRTIREDVRIAISLPAAPVPVRADRGRLGQVLMNLSVNAQDAMASGGTLTIEVTEESIPEAGGARHAVLAVRDTGVGMDEATRRSIFEPFFTTKERGHGTGLGLATVYGIVKQHGGDVEVSSAPGAGSVFRVSLPLDTGPAALPVAPAPLEPERGGTETILLAEDDESVRSLTRTLLEQAGYRVMCCRNGDESLARAREHPEAIDLLLTDVVMPDMTGKDLADRIAAERPEIEVLFTSGYTDDIIAEHGILDAATRFIPKPFDGRGLRRKVREVLDGRRGPKHPPSTAER
jgi:CheY-like chemotaxis protein